MGARRSKKRRSRRLPRTSRPPPPAMERPPRWWPRRGSPPRRRPRKCPFPSRPPSLSPSRRPSPSQGPSPSQNLPKPRSPNRLRQNSCPSNPPRPSRRHLHGLENRRRPRPPLRRPRSRPQAPRSRAGRQTPLRRPQSLSLMPRPSGPASTYRRGLRSRHRHIQAPRIHCPDRRARTSKRPERRSRHQHRRQPPLRRHLHLRLLPHLQPPRSPSVRRGQHRRPHRGRSWTRSARPSRCARDRAPRTSRMRNGLRGRRGQAPRPAHVTRRRREPSERWRLGMT